MEINEKYEVNSHAIMQLFMGNSQIRTCLSFGLREYKAPFALYQDFDQSVS